MHLLQCLPPALLAFLALSDTTSAVKKPVNSVLLSDVKTLTLRHGLKTSARRVSAIPQARLIPICPICLSCVGGSAKGFYDVDVMRCKNAGTDYDDNNVQWTCTAALPPEFKLGSTDVVCEGYDSPDDPYILKGSCGVEYRLVLTDAGEEKYGRGRPSGIYRAGANEEGGLVGLAQGLTRSPGVAVWMMYSVWRSRGARRQPGARPNWGGGGPGDGGGDDYDPPPPYTPRHPKSYPPSSSQRTGGGWWSGAATGAAAGAAAAYMAANRNNNNTNSANTAARTQRSGGFWGGGSNEAGPSSGRRSQGDGGSGWGGSGSGGSGGGARYENPATHHDLIHRYQAQYDADLAAGNIEPFVYPWGTIGPAVVLVYLLIDHRKSRFAKYTRFLAFAINLYFAAWNIRHTRSRIMAPGLGIGILSAWGVLWIANLLIVNDAQVDFKRIAWTEMGDEKVDPRSPSKGGSRLNDTALVDDSSAAQNGTTLVAGLLKKSGVTQKVPKVFWKVVNFAFVHVWFYYTSPLLVDDFAKGGIWLFEPIPISPLRGLGIVVSVFAIVILSVIGTMFSHNHHTTMGSTEDPKLEDGKAVAGAVFGAVGVYGVFLVFCASQAYLHKRESARGAIALS
ncbi:hypothetical protein B0A49_04375 [Cryomyces minteri]|uniref:Store-operated calcium entry-associated regulatory factor n=1 Tax=Cryomyces minteri TaxID=331657 RepID=A0A4U0X797_9PEZI|nr:hypothetical protein B0A49_04375 [Cryomyces minteri]